MQLIVTNSHIEKFGRTDSSINKISFINCTIGVIQTCALDVTNMNQISFHHCRIRWIEPMAITNKLRSEAITFIGNEIGTIDGQAIMGSGTSTFTFHNNT